MDMGDTPADAGTASATTLREGQAKIASLLSNPRKPDTASGEEQRQDPPKTEVKPATAETEAPAAVTEPPAEAQSDEEAPAQSTPAEKPRVRLADGTEVTLDEVDEWRKGHLRQSDYTKKTTILADERKAFEAERTAVNERAKFFEDHINMAIAIAEAHLPKAPEAALLTTDPIAYFQQKEVFERKKAELEQLFAAKQQNEANAALEQRKAFETYAAREQEALVAAIPEFKDKAKVQAFLGEVVEALPHYGFAKEDLATVHDHRLIRLIKDAIAYRKLQSAKPQAIDKAKDLPPVQEPGRRASPEEAASKARAEDFNRLKKTGRMSDATALIAKRLKAANR